MDLNLGGLNSILHELLTRDTKTWNFQNEDIAKMRRYAARVEYIDLFEKVKEHYRLF